MLNRLKAWLCRRFDLPTHERHAAVLNELFDVKRRLDLVVKEKALLSRKFCWAAERLVLAGVYRTFRSVEEGSYAPPAPHRPGCACGQKRAAGQGGFGV